MGITRGVIFAAAHGRECDPYHITVSASARCFGHDKAETAWNGSQTSPPEHVAVASIPSPDDLAPTLRAPPAASRSQPPTDHASGSGERASRGAP